MPRPLHEASELGRELRRCHRQIADLRHRLETAERVLQSVAALVHPHDSNRKPARRQIATSDSGEPVFADEPEPEPPPPDQRKRRQTWKSIAEPQLNDSVEGYWEPEERRAMDQRFVEAVRHQLQMRKRGAG
jgi:hypothetical protein